MMLKDYLKQKGISVYALSKTSGVSYSTLNDLVNGKVGIDNCRVSIVRALSVALCLSMDSFYDLCADRDHKVRNSYGVNAVLNVRNKSYFVEFEHDDKPVKLVLCKVNDDTSYYIDDIASWRVDEYIREKRMLSFV